MNNIPKILALFPGQGSQKVGMGKALFHQNEIARSYFSLANEILGFELSKICFEGPDEMLTRTEITQPAILTVSTIHYMIWASSPEADRGEIVAAAGHSLGEYSALIAAGAMTFEDGVKIVNKRGKFMQEAVVPGQGRMVAILGKEEGELEDAVKKVKSGIVDIANVNAPGQIVVAGAREAITEFLEILGAAKTIELNVSAPFHCRLMKPAAEKLKDELSKITFKRPNFAVYTNFSGKPLWEPEDIRESLFNQVCGRVRWVDSMKSAISEKSPEKAVEFGEGSVLTGLIKKIEPALPRSSAL